MTTTNKWIKTLQSILEYPRLISAIKRTESSLFFFFPYFHTGGAERVHVDILRSVKELTPTCFITDESENQDFKHDFKENSNLIHLKRWGNKKSFRKHMAKKIAQKINSTANAVIFGCNSHFFYEMLPLIDKKVKIIDLIHAHVGNNSFEEWSLHLIPSIEKRVILGTKHLEKLTRYYTENQISNKYLDRIQIIPNRVESASEPVTKQFESALNILFVARDSPEKRVNVFFDIARASYEQNLPFNFKIIGDFQADQYPTLANLHFIPRIKDKKQLNKHYAQAHFIMITSSYEGFPMVLLEAMAHGTIPIATAVGEIPAFVQDSASTGFLIDNNATDAMLVERFTEKLKLISNNRSILPTISDNVVEMVEKSFNTNTFNYRYRNLLLQETTK